MGRRTENETTDGQWSEFIMAGPVRGADSDSDMSERNPTQRSQFGTVAAESHHLTPDFWIQQSLVGLNGSISNQYVLGGTGGINLYFCRIAKFQFNTDQRTGTVLPECN